MMILGIGIDAVEIERFKDFNRHANLNRLFSPEEISYCLKDPIKSAERFAGRFAAKEAFYKALTQALGKPPAPFFTLCAQTSVQLNPAPSLIIAWDHLNIISHSALLSITHTKNNVLAQVIIQR
jgi:phosphopantetheine--protein transferase-like protein